MLQRGSVGVPRPCPVMDTDPTKTTPGTDPLCVGVRVGVFVTTGVADSVGVSVGVPAVTGTSVGVGVSASLGAPGELLACFEIGIEASAPPGMSEVEGAALAGDWTAIAMPGPTASKSSIIDNTNNLVCHWWTR